VTLFTLGFCLFFYFAVNKKFDLKTNSTFTCNLLSNIQAPPPPPPPPSGLMLGAIAAVIIFLQGVGTWWMRPLQRPAAPQLATVANAPPVPGGQQYVYHSTAQHYSKMMLRRKIAQPDHQSDRHLVSVFSFSLDRQRPHEDVKTRSPKVYVARTRCLVQRRCLRRHFEEQSHTLEMTTFRFTEPPPCQLRERSETAILHKILDVYTAD
jgi:hypothetical protein